MKLLTLALLVFAVRADIVYDVDLEQHLNKLSSPRYPIESNLNNRNSARDYILERMRYFGLDVEEQKFNTTISTDPLGISDERVLVQGTNVIGIKKAVTQHPGAVVVVGADYDSNGVDSPLMNNGAGVAALLEVVRLYSFNVAWSGRFVPNYTTVFVAFDINTKLHQSSPGIPGAHTFVQDWLMPFMQRDTNYFGGAIILDSIMNVNYDQNSQTINNNFQNMFPETYKRVQDDGGKGNFLAMVSMGEHENSLKLKHQFSGSYYKNRRASPFRLEDMQVRNGMKFDKLVQEFVKTDAIHFWSAKNASNITVNLPALLLTDTKDFRTQTSTSCVTDPCRPIDLLTEERIEFVEATVKAIIDFLFNRQATLLPPQPGAGVSSLPSALMTAFMLCLVRLYM